MKKKEICTVIRQKEIGDGIFSMWIQTENIGKEAKPGQFVWCIVSRERRPELKSFPD